MPPSDAPRIKPQAIIVCDDIRRESNGKDILIGVYSSGITFAALPIQYAVALYFVYEAPTKGSIPISIQMKFPDDETEIFRAEGVINASGGELPGETNILPLTGIPLTFKTPGLLRILVRQYDEEWQVMKTAPVRIADVPQPIPNASSIAPAPPVEQSPPASSSTESQP